MPSLPPSTKYLSGVIPFRYQNVDEPQILLVTSSRGDRWVIPKGKIEPDLSPAASAVKEAYEEAGVLGNICEDMITSYRYCVKDCEHHVEVFLFEVVRVLTEWEEMRVRKRQWCSLPEAKDKIPETELQNIFHRFRELIQDRHYRADVWIPPLS